MDPKIKNQLDNCSTIQQMLNVLSNNYDLNQELNILKRIPVKFSLIQAVDRLDLQPKVTIKK